MIDAIPSEALFAIGGLILGYFGRLLFKDRDRILQIAIAAAEKALGQNLEPGSEQGKVMARRAVIEEIGRTLQASGIKKGVENIARLALEMVLRRRKIGGG